MAKPTEQLNIRIPLGLSDRIQARAVAEGDSKTAFVVKAIERRLSEPIAQPDTDDSDFD